MGDRGNSRDWPRGQSLVELALVLPVLMIVLMGLLDLGRVFYAYVGITGAAAEGAAYGVTAARRPDVDLYAEVKKRTVEATDGLVRIADGDVEVAPASITPATDRITVTVTYDYELMTPLVRNMVGGGVLPLRAAAARAIAPES